MTPTHATTTAHNRKDHTMRDYRYANPWIDIALCAIVLMVAGLAVWIGPDEAGADTTQHTDCTGVTVKHRFVAPNQSAPHATGVYVEGPATINIVTATSTDSYIGRTKTPAQTSERWLVTAGGAASAPTQDLDDGVEAAVWYGPLGAFHVPAGRHELIVEHVWGTGPDSVYVDRFCYTVTPDVVPPALSTIAPTTTSSTTTVPVEVLPVIVEAVPAQPQVEAPQFTG